MSLSQSEEKPGTSNLPSETNFAVIYHARDINLNVGGNNSSKGINMSLLWLLTYASSHKITKMFVLIVKNKYSI